jgi:hypothetical protein
MELAKLYNLLEEFYQKTEENKKFLKQLRIYLEKHWVIRYGNTLTKIFCFVL